MRKTIATLMVVGCIGALCSINTYADALTVTTPSNAQMVESTEEHISTPSNAERIDEDDLSDYEIPADDSEIRYLSEATLSNATKSNATSIGGYFISENEYVLPKAEKEGFQFLYWSEYLDGTGEIFEAGEIFEIKNGRTTLYAQYEEQ